MTSVLPRTHPAALATTIAATALLAFPVLAQDDHVLIQSDAVEYATGPASIPEGAEFSVLYGDPGGEGLFAMRLRLPAGYHIPPHIHAQPEVVTVISGNFQIGMGEDADRDATTALAPGSFFAFPPGMVHYAYAAEDTVVQLNSNGPWTITYVKEADDPRLN